MMRAVYRFVSRGVVVGLALCALLLMVPIGIRISIEPFISSSIEEAPHAEVALVLGASVIRGVPSRVLAERADSAIALYKVGKVSKILVSGDSGALSHDEVTPVRKYLLDAGIPSHDIFLDHAGFDTYSSMYRARDIFRMHSLIVPTQDFHLPRALWIARRLGLDAHGLVAEGGERSPREYMREIFASLKAVLDVTINRQPKYLGPPLPLSGRDEATVR